MLSVVVGLVAFHAVPMAGKARATTYVETVKQVTAILFSLGMVVRVGFIDGHRNWSAGVSLDASAIRLTPAARPADGHFRIFF